MKWHDSIRMGKKRIHERKNLYRKMWREIEIQIIKGEFKDREILEITKKSSDTD